MARLGLGTDPEFAAHGAGTDRTSVCALLADVSESDHFETLANHSDPDLFHADVHFRIVLSIFAEAADRTADRAAADPVRNGHFHTVPVRSAVPFSFFCSVYLCPGGDHMGFCRKKLDKKIR